MSAKTYSLAEKAEGYSFVNGNTKFLKDMTQAELKVLAENGDTRIEVKDAPEDKKSVKPAASTPTV